jgi:membrane protein DedA with SNARE-associated domain
MDMKKPVFMFYNIIGSIIRATTMIILWTLFGKYYEWIVNNFRIIMLVLIAWIAIYIYFFKKEEFKKYLKEKNEELDELVSKK